MLKIYFDGALTILRRLIVSNKEKYKPIQVFVNAINYYAVHIVNINYYPKREKSLL